MPQTADSHTAPIVGEAPKPAAPAPALHAGVKLTEIYNGDLRLSTKLPNTEIVTDAPPAFKGKGEYITPTDLLAVALAKCTGTMLGLGALDIGVDLKNHMSIEFWKENDDSWVIKRIPLNVSITLPLTQEQKDHIVKTAVGCPVKQSIHPQIEVAARFHWADGQETHVNI